MPGTQVLVRQLAMIDGFLLDCSLSEEHVFESEVTEYPVEQGADVTDNVRPKPITVTMEALVSNTPINPDIINARSAPDESVDDAYAKLLQIRDAREPVTIRTSLRTFDNMVLKNLSIPRAAGRGDELRFTATWQQVQIVSNVRTIRVSTPIAKGPKTVSKNAANVNKVPIAINTRVKKWLDPKINGWRNFALPGAAGGLIKNDGDPRVLPGLWALIRGAPDGTSLKTWANLDNASRNALEQQLALQNMDKTPFSDEPFSELALNGAQVIIVIGPGQGVFEEDG